MMVDVKNNISQKIFATIIPNKTEGTHVNVIIARVILIAEIVIDEHRGYCIRKIV